MAEARIDEAEKRGLETDAAHMVDRQRKIWTAERNDLHDEIIESLYGKGADVPREGKAVIIGGLGGAGKTTVLERFAGFDLSRYIMINPDRIKEDLAERGLIPPVEGLSPMERSPLVHEESGHVARRLADRAYGDRKNVIWDITMSSRESVEERINDLRAAGYQEIVGIFVNIPVEKSVERALARHREGLERYRNDEGLGGRYVPPDVIRRQQTPDGGTVNRKAFEEVKHLFDRWQIYDNSVDGRGPVLVQTSDDNKEAR
jgi:predicted ABC-type ATPase